MHLQSASEPTALCGRSRKKDRKERKETSNKTKLAYQKEQRRWRYKKKQKAKLLPNNYPSIHPSIHPFIHPSIRLFISFPASSTVPSLIPCPTSTRFVFFRLSLLTQLPEPSPSRSSCPCYNVSSAPPSNAPDSPFQTPRRYRIRQIGSMRSPGPS